MKKYIFIVFLFLISFSVFAENYDTDIYEDDGVSTNITTSNSNKNQTKKSGHKKEKNQFPKLEGYLLSEIYSNTYTNNSEKIQKNDNRVDTYLYLETLIRLKITDGFFAETKWYMEPVNKRMYTGSFYADNPQYIVGDALNSDFYGEENHVRRKFQSWSYGLAVETLNVGYKNSSIALGVGKIDPTFGMAFDKTRFSGVYGITMPEEYVLTEKIGGYISAILPFGNITFNGFFDDTSGLSRTMFRDRGKNKAIGGAGNTEKLNNFSLTFDGKFDNLSLNLGFRYLNVDERGEKPERGFSFGFEYLFELSKNINFLPLFEAVYINNFKGMPSRDVGYSTVFLPFIIENWHFIFSNTTRVDEETGYHTYVSYLTQLSAGYKFDFGLMIDVARVWEKYNRKADGFVELGPKDKWVKHADSWAFMISYLFKF